MNKLEEALASFAEELDLARVPYMVVGGFANIYWGRPRLTEDLDVTVQIDRAAWAGFLARLARRFKLLPANPLEFAERTGVVPLETANGTRVDVIFSGLQFEYRAITRAVTLDVGGFPVCLCTAEDLVAMKVISERERDREDVAGIITRQGKKLDRTYLDPIVGNLAATLERPDIEVFYRSCFRTQPSE